MGTLAASAATAANPVSRCATAAVAADAAGVTASRYRFRSASAALLAGGHTVCLCIRGSPTRLIRLKTCMNEALGTM